MCQDSQSLYLCAHTDSHQITHGATIPDPALDVCKVPSRPITRDYCCSQHCCQAALSRANDRFAAALAACKAYDPSLWERIFIHDEKALLRKTLAAARKLQGEMEEKHAACGIIRSGVQDEASRMKLKRKAGEETVDPVSLAEGHKRKILEAETRGADKRGPQGTVVFPIGAQCSSRPKGKGRAFE